jgi:hypothetical protein
VVVAVEAERDPRYERPVGQSLRAVEEPLEIPYAVRWLVPRRERFANFDILNDNDTQLDCHRPDAAFWGRSSSASIAGTKELFRTADALVRARQHTRPLDLLTRLVTTPDPESGELTNTHIGN